MRAYSLTHLTDAVLLRALAALIAQDRTTTASLLAHIAEVDTRRLYLPAGYSSMHAYCVEELRLSEDSARKRIHAARAAYRVPEVFLALADGRIHLSGLVALAPYLTPENADRLLAATTHKTRNEVEQVIAEHFPRLDAPAMVQVMPEPPTPAGSFQDERAPGRVQETRVSVETAALRPKLAPLAPERFALQLTIGKGTHDKLMYPKALLSHSVHAVWLRDQGQCTFSGEVGHRCRERRFLEFDHVEPVARGGHATIEGIRLRCRAHNQYEAERTFGAGFMNMKRERARGTAAEARARVSEAQARDMMAGLRELGVPGTDARRAVEFSLSQPGATLKDRMRSALKFLCPKTTGAGARRWAWT